MPYRRVLSFAYWIAVGAILMALFGLRPDLAQSRLFFLGFLAVAIGGAYILFLAPKK